MPPKKAKKKSKGKGKDVGGEVPLRTVRCFKPVVTAVAGQQDFDRVIELAAKTPAMMEPSRDARVSISTQFPQGQRAANGSIIAAVGPEAATGLGNRAHDAVLKVLSSMELPHGVTVSTVTADEATALAAIALGLVQEPIPSDRKTPPITDAEPVPNDAGADSSECKEGEETSTGGLGQTMSVPSEHTEPAPMPFDAAVVRAATGGLVVPDDVAAAQKGLAEAAAGVGAEPASASGGKAKVGSSKKKSGGPEKTSRKGSVAEVGALTPSAPAFGLRGDCLRDSLPGAIDGAVAMSESLEAAIGAGHPFMSCIRRFCHGVSVLQACPGQSGWRPWDTLRAIQLTDDEQDAADAAAAEAEAARTEEDKEAGDQAEASAPRAWLRPPLPSKPARWEVAVSRRGVERRVVVSSSSFPVLELSVVGGPADQLDEEAAAADASSASKEIPSAEDVSTNSAATAGAASTVRIPLFPFAAHSQGPELWPAILFTAWCAAEALGDEAPQPPSPEDDAPDETPAPPADATAAAPAAAEGSPAWMACASPLSVIESLTGYRAIPMRGPDTETGLSAPWKRLFAACAPVNARTPAELLRDRALQYSANVIRWRREVEVLVDRRRLRVQELVARAGFRPTSVLGMQRARELGVLAQAESDAASDLPPPQPPAVPALPDAGQLLVLGQAKLLLHALPEAKARPATAAGATLVPEAVYAVVGCRRARLCRLPNGCERPLRATDTTEAADETVDWVRLAGPVSVPHAAGRVSPGRDLAAASNGERPTLPPPAGGATSASHRATGARLGSSATSGSASAESHASAGSEVAVSISSDPTDDEIWARVASLGDWFDLVSGASTVAIPPASAVATSPAQVMAPLAEMQEEAATTGKKGGGKKVAAKKKETKGGKGAKKGGKGEAEEAEDSASVCWCRAGETAVLHLRASDATSLSQAMLLEPLPGADRPTSPPRLLVRSWSSAAGPSLVALREVPGSRKLLAETRAPDDGLAYPWRAGVAAKEAEAGDDAAQTPGAAPPRPPLGVVDATTLPSAVVRGSVLELRSDSFTGCGAAVVWRPAVDTPASAAARGSRSRLLVGFASFTDAGDHVAAAPAEADIAVELSVLSAGWRICVGTLAHVTKAAGAAVAHLRGAALPLVRATLPGMLVPIVSAIVRVTEGSAARAALSWWMRGPAEMMSSVRCFSVRLDTADVTAHLGAGGCVLLGAPSPGTDADAKAGAEPSLGSVDVALVALVPAPAERGVWSIDAACSGSLAVAGDGGSGAPPPPRTTSILCGTTSPNSDGILFSGTVALPANQVSACGGRNRALAMTMIHATAGEAAEIPQAMARLIGLPASQVGHAAASKEGRPVPAQAPGDGADADAHTGRDGVTDDEAAAVAAMRESTQRRATASLAGVVIGSGEAVLEVRDATEDSLLRAMCSSDRAGNAVLVAVPAVAGINDDGAGDAELEAFEAVESEVAAAALPSEQQAELEGNTLAASLLLRGWRASSVWGEAQALLDPERPDAGAGASANDLTLRVVLRLRAVPRAWRSCPPYEAVAGECIAHPVEASEEAAPGEAILLDAATTAQDATDSEHVVPDDSTLKATSEAKADAALNEAEEWLDKSGKDAVAWRIAVVSHAGAVTAAAVSGPAVLSASVLDKTWDSHSEVALRYTEEDDDEAAAASGKKAAAKKGVKGGNKAAKKGSGKAAEDGDAPTDIGAAAVADLLPSINPIPIEVRWHAEPSTEAVEHVGAPLAVGKQLNIGADAKLSAEALRMVLAE